MTAAVVRAAGLTKRFGPLTALQPLDLALAPGETLALLGPNGAGKSTLLRLLAGLARPSGGSLAVGPDGATRPARRAAVGLVAHATFLYAQLSARENLTLAAKLYGVPRPSARAAVLVTHELGRAVQLATHALVLVRGRARALAPAALASAGALEAAYRDAVAALEAAA